VEQERLVRVYHDMGLNPRQIAERAHESAPRLAITESLAVIRLEVSSAWSA
jgi:hypothetical protein